MYKATVTTKLLRSFVIEHHLTIKFLILLGFIVQGGCGNCLASSPEVSPDFSTFEMAYSQSASAWSTVNAIKGAHGQIAVINNILNQHYGTFEGAFTRVGGSVISVPTGWSLAPARDLDFNLGVEGAASGRAQNPVVPEIRANLTLALVAGVGLEGELPGTSVKSHFGVFGGYGNEKRIDAVSTDLIESVPIRKGDLTLLGFEEGLEYAWTDAAEIRYQSQLHLRETLGFSNTAPDKLGIEDTGGHSAFRWRVDSRAKLPSGIQLQVVLGPQPLPIELLPRI